MTTVLPASPRKRTLLLVAVVAAVLVVLAIVVIGRRTHRGVEARGPKRIVVLSFDNLGGAEDDYFVDGLADGVRGRLASLTGLEVIARASSAAYKNAPKKPAEIAGELGVRYLLKATVRRQRGAGMADRVQVNPELLEVAGSGAPISRWKKPMDAELANVFRMQSDIARHVVCEIGAGLGEAEEKRLAGRPTENLAAYNAFLRGEEASKRGPEDPPSLRRVLSFYDQATALDPGFSQAWAQVSVTNSLLYGNGAADPEVGERARSAAKKAIVLAPDSPEWRKKGSGMYSCISETASLRGSSSVSSGGIRDWAATPRGG